MLYITDMCVMPCYNGLVIRYLKILVMNMIGDRELVSRAGRSRCLLSRTTGGGRWLGPGAGRRSYTGVQKGNSTGREKASNVVREIGQ